jgi:hypothetical protein
MAQHGANEYPVSSDEDRLDAKRLALGLQGLIVGLDGAVEQLVSFYQAYLTGMTLPGRPIAFALGGRVPVRQPSNSSRGQYELFNGN